MFIKYNGTKDKKTLQYHKEHYGVMTYVWEQPTMVIDVVNPPFARFLLHPDREGLFSMVDDLSLKKPEPPKETEIPKEPVVPKKPKCRKKKVRDVD